VGVGIALNKDYDFKVIKKYNLKDDLEFIFIDVKITANQKPLRIGCKDNGMDERQNNHPRGL
jgi:hypothetical protein